MGESCSLPLSREDAERALNELKRIGGRQVSVSMATKRKRNRKRGKTAITNNDHDESNLPVDEVDEEHGSIAEEDVDGGSSLGEHCCIVLLAPTSDHCSLYTFIDAHTYIHSAVVGMWVIYLCVCVCGCMCVPTYVYVCVMYVLYVY